MKKSLRKKLDILWSKKVRERDKWCKRHVGKNYSSRLNAHHIITKSTGDMLRWDVVCGISLCCIPCHKWGENSAHNNPAAFQKWYRLTFPHNWRYLQKRKKIIFSFKDWHYPIIKEAIEDLRPLKEVDYLLRGEK